MVKIHLEELLWSRRLRQIDLVNATGIRKNTINDLYHELALGIKFEHLEKICKVLNCSMTDLIEIVPDEDR